MRHHIQLSVVLVLLVFAGSLPLSAQELDEHLAMFTPLVGKTWKGRLSAEGAEKESWDVSRWERALNGKAVRIMHSVNDGEYGGETLIVWNREEERVEFYYFTTAGFFTQGTITGEFGNFTAHEYVTGNANGITEVRSSSTVLEDGSLKGSSEYLKDDEWVPGHEIIYKEAPDAEVTFK
ncbi:MAG: hypothetical protein C0600_03175 [Ignavibacteria bacterium]|nr:MAG: hypothetical protein C0600_03175 [Ignavibacteria bacterium]